MRTEKEIRERIANFEKDWKFILTGSIATIQINAPRALAQISAEATLSTLYWALGKTYKSKLKGTDT